MSGPNLNHIYSYELHSYVWPIQTFTDKIRHVTSQSRTTHSYFIWSSIRTDFFLWRTAVCGIDSGVDAFSSATVLITLSWGSIVIYPLYLHNPHFLFRPCEEKWFLTAVWWRRRRKPGCRPASLWLSSKALKKYSDMRIINVGVSVSFNISWGFWISDNCQLTFGNISFYNNFGVAIFWSGPSWTIWHFSVA